MRTFLKIFALAGLIVSIKTTSMDIRGNIYPIATLNGNLSYVAGAGNIRAVELLLKSNTNPNHINPQNRVPIANVLVGFKQGRMDRDRAVNIIMLLLSYGADPGHMSVENLVKGDQQLESIVKEAAKNVIKATVKL